MTLNSHNRFGSDYFQSNEEERTFRLNRSALNVRDKGLEDYVFFNDLSLINTLTPIKIGLELLPQRENPPIFSSNIFDDWIFLLTPEFPLQGYKMSYLVRDNGLPLSHMLFRNPNLKRIGLLREIFGDSITNYVRNNSFDRNKSIGVYSPLNQGINISVPLSFLDSDSCKELLNFDKTIIYSSS